MPKFKKQIITEGRYLVTKPDGSREFSVFDKGRLNTISDNTKKMIEAGLKIPAPFKHHKDAVPVTEVLETNSFDNSGYWDRVWTEETDGKTSLWGEVDSPGDTKDYNTPAGKLQNTVKEVSICVKDSFTDGLGRNWGPCMLHAAPVLHPVVPGQTEFSLVSDAIALSMSGIEQLSSMESISELSKALQDAAKIYLPPGTLQEDLVGALLISLKQFQLCNTGSDDSEVVEQTPVFMSSPEGTKPMPVTKKEAEHLLSLGAINPKTNKPFTLEEFDIKADPRDAFNLSLSNEVVDSQKKALKSRVEALVATGRTTKDYAEAKLYPAIESYDIQQLSYGEVDGKTRVNPPSISMVIESLESLPATSKKSSDQETLLSNFEEIVENVDQSNHELTPEQGDAMVKEMLSMMP